MPPPAMAIGCAFFDFVIAATNSVDLFTAEPGGATSMLGG